MICYNIVALTVIFCKDFFEIDLVQAINVLQPNLMFADCGFIFFPRSRFIFVATFAAASAPIWHSKDDVSQRKRNIYKNSELNLICFASWYLSSIQYPNYILWIKEFSWVEQKKIWSCYKFEEIRKCCLPLSLALFYVPNLQYCCSQLKKRRKFKNQKFWSTKTDTTVKLYIYLPFLSITPLLNAD